MAYSDLADPRNKAAKRRYYQANRDRYRERNVAKEAEIRKFLQGIKSVPCMDCGGIFPPCVMDLHHRDSTEKSYAPARLPKTSLAIAKAEVAKCDVICSNCHRLRHHG